jgi:glycosyltransferase involved in cell wall biosynthesis
MLMQWPMGRSKLRKKFLLKLFQRGDLEGAAGLVATSQQEATDMRALGLVQPIAIIPNGVAIGARSGIRQVSDHRRLVFLSRIHPKKGLTNLLKAWALLRPRGWRLVIAGPDEVGHRAELESLATRLQIGGSIEFVGPIAEREKVRFLELAEVVVLPSESENFGMVIAEALSLGIPVIASTGTPWQEVATTGCGWWIPNDVESLLDSLREATDKTPAELDAMGALGRELADRYSWKAVGAMTVAFYRWILGEGVRPSYVDTTATTIQSA